MAIERCRECGSYCDDENLDTYLTYDGHLCCGRRCRDKYEEDAGIRPPAAR